MGASKPRPARGENAARQISTNQRGRAGIDGGRAALAALCAGAASALALVAAENAAAKMTVKVLRTDGGIAIAIVGAGIAVIAGGALLVMRSGNQSEIEPSKIELMLRHGLTSVLSVRPRFKSFLVGFPVMMLVPALLRARRVLAVVPEARKAEPVRAALEGPVGTWCPASILQRTPHAAVFLDPDSAALLS